MGKTLSVKIDGLSAFLPAEEVIAFSAKSALHLDTLIHGRGAGSDFLGWLGLPQKTTQAALARIEKCAARLRSLSDTTVVIGIGGSYLGGRAVIEALTDSFEAYRATDKHQVLFAGQNLCSDYMYDLMCLLDNRNYSIIVISKSGTTIEPAIAFRLLRDHLERRTGKKEAAARIVAITDKSKGAVKKMADIEGYETFVIPDDVGGRYSVMTVVGLLPLAVAGINIHEFLKGASVMHDLAVCTHDPCTNPSLLYASARNLLYRMGKKIEIMVNYTPRLYYITEWWKQLFGESEGKEGKGIFPASVNNTTDLHSMGQYIQEGERILFETVLSVAGSRRKLTIPLNAGNEDNLNFLAGKTMAFVNAAAEQGVRKAHTDGGVPNLTVDIPELNEFWLGQLMYMMEVACGISSYILEVNPFDQPGVEAYKKNMYNLLGRL